MDRKTPLSRWTATIKHTTATALAAAFLVSLIDLARAVNLANPELGAGLSARLFVGLAAFYLAIGMVLGAVEGVLLAGFKEFFHKRDAPSIWKSLCTDSERDARWAAGILSAAVGVGVVGIVTYAVHAAVSSGFANQSLAAVFIAGVAAAAALTAALVFFPVFVAAHRLMRRIPFSRHVPRTAVTAAMVVLFTPTVVGFMASRADWRVINLSPFIALGQLLVLQALLWVLARRLDAQVFSARAPWIGTAVCAAAAAGGLFYSAGSFNRSPTVTAAAADCSWAGPVLLRLGRSVTDRDHDGYAAYFGGGDCDDSNPAVHPGAVDVPGDGIDQDCLGGDARLPAKPVRLDRGKLNPIDPLRRYRFDGDFLVIIVDTLRQDRLGIENYPGKLTPNIDRLAAESVFFRNAYAQGNRTPHSFGSFLTSRYPSRVQWKRRRASYSPILDDNLMVFESLREAGYRNVAVLRHFYFHPKRNLAQGFAPGDFVNRPPLTIKATNTDIPAPDITARAIRRLTELKAAGKRFCLWVHYPDPHSRYMIHRQFPITSKGLKGLEQKYDHEIKFTDLHVGKLLAALADLGLHRNTAVVLFSDHGEAFGKHRFKGKRMFFHGQTLYNELLNVPLLFRVPGIRPRVVEDRVMLLDIAPTLLDMARRPIPRAHMGSSLVPYFFGRKLPPRIIRAELLPYTNWKHHAVMMIKGKWKLIYRISDNLFELYDLEKDPDEMRNVAYRNRDVLKELRREIRNY